MTPNSPVTTATAMLGSITYSLSTIIALIHIHYFLLTIIQSEGDDLNSQKVTEGGDVVGIW